jgi:hypothetical protein
MVTSTVTEGVDIFRSHLQEKNGCTFRKRGSNELSFKGMRYHEGKEKKER